MLQVLNVNLLIRVPALNQVLFTVNVVENQGKFGVKFSNGNVSGGLGSLQSGRADLVMTAYFVKVLINIFYMRKSIGIEIKSSCWNIQLQYSSY